MSRVENQRKIIHLDMDCFYAAVEIRDNPSLKNKPVAIGGPAHQRSVLATCNYEARQYGLHSAMPTSRALQLCPSLILLPVNMQKYRDISKSIFKTFKEYTEIIEPLSLDEAFLDVSENTECHGSATWLAEIIRQRIFAQQQLTVSAGIAPNKFLAKIASDWQKPNGLFTIKPEMVIDFMLGLPVGKIPGVGEVTENKLHQLNIKTCGDLQRIEKQVLEETLGKLGERLYTLCRGIDDRPVNPNRIRKSLSAETTFPHDLSSLAECITAAAPLYTKLIEQLKKHDDREIHKLYIKIKFFDFTQTTVECTAEKPEQEKFETLIATGYQRENKAVRLLGLGVRFKASEEAQLSLVF